MADRISIYFEIFVARGKTKSSTIFKMNLRRNRECTLYSIDFKSRLYSYSRLFFHRIFVSVFFSPTRFLFITKYGRHEYSCAILLALGNFLYENFLKNVFFFSYKWKHREFHQMRLPLLFLDSPPSLLFGIVYFALFVLIAIKTIIYTSRGH